MTMNQSASRDAYGVLTEPATLTIQRVLPGPIDRVWAYLTQSELRRQWLASGEMDLKLGATFELVWRNDELTNPPGKRPDGFDGKHQMECTITALDPPHKLGFTWGRSGGVEFELSEQGKHVLLTVTHHRLPDPEMLLRVSAGWHMHLDVLAARVSGTEPEPFWDGWARLREEYTRRLSA
jgi:uncharacterized protein YndB with AHSA1/START domain